MHLDHDEGYLPTFSVRYAAYSTLKTSSQVFALLEVFKFWFLPLRFARSSSGNVGNLSFAVISLKKVLRNEKNWQISVAKLRHCQLTTELTLCFVLIG